MTTNPLVKSVLVVLATWWLVFAYMSTNSANVLQIITNASMVAACAIIGVVGVYMLMRAGRSASKSNLAGTSKRGISINLGTIPIGLGEPSRRKGASLVPGNSRLYRWYEIARISYPAHAALLQACLEIYADKEDLPASPVPGGHGGLSLMDHALHVAEVTLELAETWVYTGTKSKDGRIRVPLIDHSYVFDREDPLIPVLAFAHDIGKIECYGRNDNGELVEYRQDHDLVSGLILSRINETWSLPHKDRVALLYAVSHYHHPSDLPLHVDDRTRAIMELLIAADVEASRREGDPDRAKAWKTLLEEPDEDDMLWEAFVDLMAVPSAINGSDRETRVGYKYGNYVYLSEERIRFALASALNTPGAADTRARMGDGRYKITERLMQIMMEKGVLYHVHEGKEYSVARALFRVTFVDPRNEEFAVEMPAVIIVKPANELANLLNKSDSRLVPMTVAPLYSEASARNKSLRSQPVTHGTGVEAHRPEDSAPTAAQSPAQGNASEGAVIKSPQRTEVKRSQSPGSTQHVSALDMLMKLKEDVRQSQRERSRKKPEMESVIDTARHNAVSAIRLALHAHANSLRYRIDTNNGLAYVMLDDMLTNSIGEQHINWLGNSSDPDMSLRVGKNAKYLVVKADILYEVIEHEKGNN